MITRNPRANNIVTPIVNVDEKLAAKSPFQPVQEHLRRINELQGALAAIHSRARDAVAELRDVESQLAQEVAAESYDGAREAELVAERDRCRAQVDPEIFQHRVMHAERRIRDEVAAHDRHVADHAAELIAALEQERVAAEKAWDNYQAAGQPIRQRYDNVHARLQEIAQYA